MSGFRLQGSGFREALEFTAEAAEHAEKTTDCVLSVLRGETQRLAAV
jgi:hypothetical protein